MRAHLFVLPICICGVAALTAQTPAPSSAPAASHATPGKPLRHLEFTFSVSTQGMVGYEYSAISGAANSGGAGNAAVSEGGNGTMSVDVLSVGTDGSLVVRISEQVQNQPRAGQAYTCSVYGNTTVLCPSVPAPSQAEWVLLGYLGRQFIDGAPWDAQGHWSRKEQSDQFTLQEDFTLVDAGDGKKVIVREVRKMDLHNGGFNSQTDNVLIHYDRAMEVPDVVQDDSVSSGGNGAGHATYQFTLLRDSFAKP